MTKDGIGNWILAQSCCYTIIYYDGLVYYL